MTRRALVLIDWINEITHPEGKLAAARNYPEQLERHGVFDALQRAIDDAVAAGDLLVAPRLGFLPDYSDLPAHSPILSGARENGILRIDTWSTALTDRVLWPEQTISLHKNRVSAFAGSRLDQILRRHAVEAVRIAGIATNITVESTARLAHDLDYRVEVVADACAAPTPELHERALASIASFGTVL